MCRPVMSVLVHGPLGLAAQVVVSGQGKHFCAGIDVGYLRDNFLTLQRVGGSDPGRQREALLHSILALQVGRDHGFMGWWLRA